jgi:hypothetical protein
MTPDQHKHWEAQLDAELKALPEVAAPPRLAQCVMERIQRPAFAAPRPRTWQSLPSVVRASAFAIIVAAFGLLCVAAWVYPSTGGFAAAGAEISAWLRPVAAGWNVAQVTVSALLVAVRCINPMLLILWAGSAAFAYFIIMAAGTVVYKWAASKQ